MDKNNKEDRDKIKVVLAMYFTKKTYNTEVESAINDIFNLFEPPQYIPYTSKDFDQFMYKEVRRKGENFKDEVCLIEGCSVDEGILITIPINTDDYKTDTGFNQEWKSFDTVLKEWEYLDGGKIGKKV